MQCSILYDLMIFEKHNSSPLRIELMTEKISSYAMKVVPLPYVYAILTKNSTLYDVICTSLWDFRLSGLQSAQEYQIHQNMIYTPLQAFGLQL